MEVSRGTARECANSNEVLPNCARRSNLEAVAVVEAVAAQIRKQQ